MGANQSAQVVQEEDDDDDADENVETRELNDDNSLVKKVLEQEPEMLTYHASASPLSPQLSSFGTPRLGPSSSIKVWDPYNVLAPPPPPQFVDRTVTEVFLISHGECHINLRPDLVGGLCPEATLTPIGNRQARALAVFLKSQGVRFHAVYTSPLDRARATAVSVCQETNFAAEHIQSSDALVDMSMGHWEGCHRSKIYTPEMLSFMDRLQPDFFAPSGESFRQVEFRMVQFLNGIVLGLPEKLRSDFSSPQNEIQGFSHHNSHSLSNSFLDRDGPSLPAPHWDLLHRNRQGIQRKKSGKSRLQFVTTTSGDHEAEDEMSPQEFNNESSFRDINVRSSSSLNSSSICVFTHSVPIKCLLTGLLGCSPIMSQKICIEDSSVSVLRHSWKLGWQIKRLNDTAHLRLL
ncbi:uncharacterized protein LOC132315607 [Cornus florida]|uniref:uncharacterized protein LOC132315607 n=1 Tax=Cornus florida TaxID=4283 RepID=UPI0028A20BA2|nr:uncharacterized protein LOC132315607 [Cornus florida]